MIAKAPVTPRDQSVTFFPNHHLFAREKCIFYNWLFSGFWTWLLLLGETGHEEVNSAPLKTSLGLLWLQFANLSSLSSSEPVLYSCSLLFLNVLVRLLFSPNIVYFPFGSHELPLWAIVSWIDQLTSSLPATGYCGNPLAIKAITGTPLKSDHQKALLSRAHSLAFKPKFSFKTNNNNNKKNKTNANFKRYVLPMVKIFMNGGMYSVLQTPQQ